jgi:hypothetical protein
VLLGSSARRFKTAATNLLTGRATLRTLYPLVPAELGEHYDLERVLRFGSIPLVWQADDPRATLDHPGRATLRGRRLLPTFGTRRIALGLLDRVKPQVGDHSRDGLEVPVVVQQDKDMFHGDARDQAVVAAAGRSADPPARLIHQAPDRARL